jgi:catechol 2,3-dioxygenase-like lactoylglutathione lyase family enzyme
MLKKVVYVALLVSDQDKALDFYTNVIGLEKRIDSPTPARMSHSRPGE